MFLKFQIEIYQWLGPIIALFFIYRIISQFRANRRLLLGTVIWVAFWAVVIVLSVIPDLLSNYISGTLGFKNNINAVIFVALGFLFVMTYNQSSTIERLEKQITHLVRSVALEKQEKKDLLNQIEKQTQSLTKQKAKASKSKKSKTLAGE